MIENLRIGEIVRIDNKDYIIANTLHKNGRMDWEQPTLIQLEHFIKKTEKKLRGCSKQIQTKKFKSLKLTLNKK